MTQPDPLNPAPADQDQGDKAEAERVFKQADVDRIIATRLKATSTEMAALQKKAEQFDKLQEASASELEKAVLNAKRETEAQIRSEVTRDRVLDRIEVLAAKDFADPEDARLRLGQRADEFVNAEGKVDADSIKAAIDDLLSSRPHLAAVRPDGRPKGNADLGGREKAPPTDPRLADLAQIEADLQRKK